MANSKESRNKLMRLYNIYYICTVCKNEIDDNVRIREKRNSNNAIIGYEILGWEECRNALEQLKKISCMKEYSEAVYSTLNIFERDKIIPEVSTETKDKFERKLNDFKIALEAIQSLYDSLNIGKSSAGIDIKIPKCNSLKEYMDYLKDIDFILTQCPYLTVDDEEVRFNNVDVGSQWLTFFIFTAGTFSILNNLAKIVDKAVAIKSHILLLKQQEKMLKEMQTKQEVLEETVDVFKKMKSDVLDGSIKDLENEIGELKDGEERGKVSKTLEKLTYLMDKGVEIYSSIETPNEIKALFPMNDDNPILPDNIVKLLEKKEEQ